MKYNYYKWLNIEANPYFERYDKRFRQDFWMLKRRYNQGLIEKPASDEFIAYIDLLLENVFNPIFEEFLEPDNEGISKVMKVMVQSLIEGRFDELVRSHPNEIDRVVSKKLDEEKQRLLDELMAADNEELHDRGFYSEYVRKNQELEYREREQEFLDREREMANAHRENLQEYKEREIQIMRREMAVEMEIREKDIEIKHKLIEIEKIALEARHDKHLAEIATKLLEIQKEGIAHKQDLLGIENKLLQVRNSNFEAKVRDTVASIRERQAKLQSMKQEISLDRKRLLMDHDRYEFPRH